MGLDMEVIRGLWVEVFRISAKEHRYQLIDILFIFSRTVKVLDTNQLNQRINNFREVIGVELLTSIEPEQNGFISKPTLSSCSID